MNLKMLLEEKESFHSNIEKKTIKNKKFREILFTTKEMQLVIMSLKPNQEIGKETHKNGSQFIRAEEGNGEAIIGDKKYNLKDGDVVVIPSGIEHNIIAGEDGLKIYVIYSPPEH